MSALLERTATASEGTGRTEASDAGTFEAFLAAYGPLPVRGPGDAPAPSELVRESPAELAANDFYDDMWSV